MIPLTSSELRRSFLDFFRSKEHTIVPSSSLLPDSPNLLFTNAGMNQFVPIFLGKSPCTFNPPRTADSQKCIRAGGKHNDLEDVGLDTYHHTFFEMLGNWSFNDYFKKEAISWAWELLVERWKFPAERLYATVYQPESGDPSTFDQESYDLWAELFTKAGLNPKQHIVPGNRNDNFWMMGETGPCGPCSELHIDLTPYGDTKGALVNKGTAECIEIWNLVFIQFNANSDGTFVPLPTRHVDTGMGFERVCSIIQATRGFQEFSNVVISNYETDLFRPLFDELEKKSSLRYGYTLPQPSKNGELVPHTEQEKIDIAFRVIADHLRTLGFAIADGIQPGNNERNYVLRRILRRAVRYGKILGFQKPFLYQLVPRLSSLMGEAFPELRNQEKQIAITLHREEEAFHKTLEKGLALFEAEAAAQKEISGALAFRLYDEQGFPLDLTELLARERGLSVDLDGFNVRMKEQRERARAAQKKEVINVSSITTSQATEFLGFDQSTTEVQVLEVLNINNRTALIFDRSVCYAEMGGQVGDTGTFQSREKIYSIVDTQKQASDKNQEAFWLHFLRPLSNEEMPLPNTKGTLQVDTTRRSAIERHHTVTHLLHWALHQVVSPELIQKGSFVGSDKLTFDFNSAPLTPEQLKTIERLVNETILHNHPVTWSEVSYEEVKKRPEIMQFFGDKYGDRVRVVQIGGDKGIFNGFSMELCGGTHVRNTGEIGLFKIVSEGAVAAGIRRIEATAGLAAHHQTLQERELIRSLASKLQSPVADLEKKLEGTLTKMTALEKELKVLHEQMALGTATKLLAQSIMLGTIPSIIAEFPETDAAQLQTIANAMKGRHDGVILLVGIKEGAISLMASVSDTFKKTIPAGKLIQTIAPLIGGKGGGTSEAARGGGSNRDGLAEALTKAKEFIASGSLG